MAKIDFLYGRDSLALDIPDERLEATLVSRAHAYQAKAGEEELVRLALEKPIGSPRLSELARGRDNIVILASDHTRPVPSRIIFPAMIEEIRRGNPKAVVTVLISTGCHRATTRAELENKFGPGTLDGFKVAIHDCDESAVTKIGRLPSGAELLLNKLAVEADLLVAEGFIEPHFFAGFSGGRKSVFPGVTNRSSVMANHCSEFIAHPLARTGFLDNNPIHADMVAAAGQAKLAFIVNVVLGSAQKVIKAFAGHYDQAHRAGADFLAGLAGVKAAPADIVITTNGGYPLDQNLYQAVKGLTAAEATVKPGGIIIMAARGEDGHGGESFWRTFKEEKNLEAMMAAFMARRPDETIADQWQSQILARVLLKAKVIMVTQAPTEMVNDLHMLTAPTLAEALKMADEILGHKRGRITAIPDGIGVIVR
ncbi:nickel-dependent lactate racemase [Deltaproteobacteria bacterium OttesenSCG-928-K17]|nr:nickel-dependent lactate racemase [Deltaproteobacteria bacterium OttesenSCG-928-K17]